MNASSNAATVRSGVTFEISSAIVTGRTNEGSELRAALLKLTRRAAVLEFYGGERHPRLSEVFEDFTIEHFERKIFIGKAVVRHLVETDLKLICELELQPKGWQDPEFEAAQHNQTDIRKEYQGYFQEWQKTHLICAEYKIVVADLHSYLSGLQAWLEQYQLLYFNSPNQTLGADEEQMLVESLLPEVMGPLTHLFARFEQISDSLEPSSLPAHREFIKRHLHPFLLSSPFMYRTFTKPLGYAGDYEMMSMIVNDRWGGRGVFARLVDGYLLAQHPCEAVRNRVGYLKTRITQEALRTKRLDQPINVFCVACGPAWEAIQFISESPLADQARFHLLDFNSETLDYANRKFRAVIHQHQRQTQYSLVKNSVHNLLRANAKGTKPTPQYDLIYCSGLYDYLSDRVCQSLNNHLYNLLRPDGLMVIGNFAPFTNGQNLMEHLMDWFLIYRDAKQIERLAPELASRDTAGVSAEFSGANIFLEVRKPR